MATNKASKKTVRKKARKVTVKKEPDRKVDRVVDVLSTNELLQGKYCNVGVIKHTLREFILDFILTVDNRSTLVSRVITSPAHAREIYEALGKNIERYEKTHGKILLKDKIKGGSLH